MDKLLRDVEECFKGEKNNLIEFFIGEDFDDTQSDELAFENWLASAEFGYAPAQVGVGASYIIGSGVDKDLSQAKRWLQLAIDSTYQRYSRAAQTIYKANELHKY
mgnify:CR=1 FL=1